MDKVIIKSSGKFDILLFVTFITFIGCVIIFGLEISEIQKLFYSILIFITSIITFILIGNKTFEFTNDRVLSYFSLSPFKRTKSILYSNIIMVEQYTPVISKLLKFILSIHYTEKNVKRKISISISNDIAKLDDIVNLLKQNGVTNIKTGKYKPL